MHQVSRADFHNLTEWGGFTWHLITGAVHACSTEEAEVDLCAKCFSFTEKTVAADAHNPKRADDDWDDYDDLYVQKGFAPENSIAAGQDMGTFYVLEQANVPYRTSTLEEMVLAKARCNLTFNKLTDCGKHLGKRVLTSFICVYPHQPVDAWYDDFTKGVLEAALQRYRFLCVGPNPRRQALERAATQHSDGVCRAVVLFNNLQMLARLHGHAQPPSVSEMQTMINEAHAPAKHHCNDENVLELEKELAKGASDVASGRANPGCNPDDDATAEEELAAEEGSPVHCSDVNAECAADEEYGEAATNAVGVLQCHEDSGATVARAIRKLAGQGGAGGDNDAEEEGEDDAAATPKPKHTQARAFTMRREQVRCTLFSCSLYFALARAITTGTAE